MRTLSFRLLSFLIALLFVPAAFAHDVTVTGTQSFASLDGSSSDHDGLANGVFTVNDGNLIVNGVVNCNDDSTESACSMAFSVSGDMTVGSGGALYAENRSGTGTGGAITLTVGGSLSLSGNAILSTASKSSSGSTGGAITANVTGNVTLGSGTTIDSGSANARGGAIAMTSGGAMSVDGNVLSGPSRTFLATRLDGGAALDGGTSNTIGGSISLLSSTFAEPAMLVGPNGNIVSQGADLGAGPVTLDACGIQIRGLVAALSKKDGVAKVSIRSGKDVLIDGRDLGASGTRMGRVRADAPTGTAINKGVDVFAAETIDIFGPSNTYFVITSHPGVHDSKSFGGLIRITSLEDAVNASGNVADDGKSAAGDTGGTIEISAKANVNLNTAVIRAVGDFNTNNSNRGGGTIHVRSYSGSVVWTNGLGEVRPVGSTSGLATTDQGAIVLTACGTVDVTGTSFPVMGTATSVFPETHTGVCSPAAPSLPVGAPPLVTCNTPPVANDASASTNEDTTVTITLSGTDADGDPLTFSIVSGPANGSLGPIVPTGPTTATVNYTPNLNYNGSDSFVYQANDGNGGTDNATVTITIAPVNDPPSFLAGSTVTVLEDSGAQTIANWATSISAGPADESGQTVTFTVTNDNPSLFSVQPALSSNGTLTFTPAANAYGSATITIVAQDNGGTANGGNDTSAAQTSSITVTGVNDEPSFVKGADQTVNEDAGAQTVSGWATSISAGPNETQGLTFLVSSDNPSLFSAGPAVSASGTLTYTPAANANGTATVTVVLQDDGGTANGGDDTSAAQTFTITVNGVNDEPSFTSGGNVTELEDSGAYSASWATAISAGPADESGQTLTFSVSNDNSALFSVQPAIASDGTLTFTTATNAFGSATVTVTLSDNGGTANGGDDTSAAQTFTLTITAVNDEPSFTSGGNVTVNEDSGAYSAAWASAISAGPGETQTLTFVVSNDNNALFASQPALAANGTLSFTPAADANGSATVTVYLQDDGGTANGGDDTSASVTFTITINAVNDAPSFVSGGNVTVNEDSGAYSAAWATSISAGPANESGQALTFNITGNSNRSLFSVAPSISASGVLGFTLAANASGSATITVTLSDDGGTANGGVDTSAPQTFTVTVNSVNDAPSFTSGGDVTVNEDSGAYSAAWATAISAGPGESGQTVTFFASNSNNALFSAQPSIDAAGVLTFTPAPNAYGTATVSVYAQDNGGTANGGVDTSATVTFTITVNGVNDPPAAGNDSWETEGNTELRVDHGANTTPHVADTTTSGTGVLDNDVDAVEGDPFAITGIVGCADTTAPFVCAVTGGTVTLESNGSFTFEPNPGATSATFQYTVTDMPSAGSPASANGTVNITIHDMIWYVNGGAAAGGNGTSTSPFNDLSSLNGSGDVDGAGDYIFVHNSAVSGSISMETNQKLWGEGVGLIIPRNLNGNGSPATLVAAGTRPTVTAIAGDVVLVSGVTGVDVAGLNLNTASGNGIDVTSLAAGPATSATIRSSSVMTTGTEGIDINAGSASGTSVAIDGTDVTAMANGIDLLATDGDVVFSYSNGTVTSAVANGIVLNGSAADSLTVTGLANVTISGNTAGSGISITAARFDANPGTSAFDNVAAGSLNIGVVGDPVGGAALVLTGVSGDLSFASLNAHGGTTGVTIAGSGLFTGSAGMRVTSAGGAVTAAAGVGLSVSNASIGAANVSLTSLSSNGGANGILLNNTGSAGGLKILGTGSAGSGGTIQNTSSHGVSLASTSGPAFNNVIIQNTAGSGVKGTAVTGFAYTNGTINNSGTGGGANESNIAFNTVSSGTESNVSGAVSITGNSLTNALWHGVDIANYSGTISSIDVSGNTITSATSGALSKGSAVRVQVLGSSSTVANLTAGTFSNNVISNFPSGAGIQLLAGNSAAAGSAGTFGVVGSGTNVVSVTGNQIHGLNAATRMGTSAIIVGLSGRGQGNVDVSGNGTAGSPLANVTGIAISVGVNGFQNAVVKTDNNVIAANNAFGSAGIGGGTGVTFSSADTPSLSWSIQGNTISATDGNGILAVARSATGSLGVRIRGNTVAAPLTGVRQGIRVDAGNAGSVNDSVCLDIAANTSAGSGGATGIGLRKQGTSTTINAFGIQGLSPSPAASPAVETYVDSQNPAGGSTQLISATSGFTACSLP